MKRSLLLFMVFAFLNACEKKEAIDPFKRVRPVVLRIAASDSDYKLTWEEVRLICITSPCPDVADVEAEEYEIQITTEELGVFRTYQTVNADKKSISIPAAGRGGQLVARIVSKAKGAPPVNSNAVMVTNGLLSQSAYYPGFGISGTVMGGDVTTDGTKATYSVLVEETPGQYVMPLYWAALQNEQVASAKLISPLGRAAKFSRDGQQLAYIFWPDNELIVYDITTGQKRTLPVVEANRIQSLDWSPDGKWLAFSTVSDEESRLWKIATSGGSAVPLTPPMPVREFNNIRQADIDWSPDGQFIAVSRARSDNANKAWRAVVSLYSPEGNGEVKYFETQPGWIDTNPAFSPDGKQLAFLSTRTDPSAIAYSLWVRDLTTGKVRRVELLPGLIPSDDYVPHWQGNERLLFMGTLQGKKGYFSVFL